MIQISDIKVALHQEKEEIINKTIKKLTGQLYPYVIVRESLDARKGILFVYTIQAEIPKNKLQKKFRDKILRCGKRSRIADRIWR